MYHGIVSAICCFPFRKKILSTSRVGCKLSHTGNYATTAITVLFRGEVGTLVDGNVAKVGRNGAG